MGLTALIATTEFIDILERKKRKRPLKVAEMIRNCIIFVHYNVHKCNIMVIISSAELRNNMKKYLDLAKTEKVVIQRGRNETFVLVAQNNMAEEDLSRAITVDEVLARVREGLNEMFERKEGSNIA